MKDIDINSFDELEFHFLKDLSELKDYSPQETEIEFCDIVFGIVDNQIIVKSGNEGYKVYSDVDTSN